MELSEWEAFNPFLFVVDFENISSMSIAEGTNSMEEQKKQNQIEGLKGKENCTNSLSSINRCALTAIRENRVNKKR